MSGWQQQAEGQWILRLDEVYTLELDGLSFWLHPADEEIFAEYRWSDVDSWLEIGLEAATGDWADGGQLDTEVDMLGTLASGEVLHLRVGVREWQVEPFLVEMLD